MTSNYLSYSKEVQKAMTDSQPIVALESTIITHGMPYPQNLEMAKKVEQIIRDNGAVPATIAVIDGKIKIGLEAKELELLAKSPEAIKVSRRDFAYVLASKKVGATTVAGTMIAAKLAGIKFFVTGGIGGVHRGFNEDMDVSADLDELAKTSICVICAGAKAILDLPRTLEYLETKGVPVIGYKTDYLPAFYTAKSAYKLALRLDNPDTIAKLVHAQAKLGLEAGVLVTNPIPVEHELDGAYMDTIINAAVKEAHDKHIKGKDVTPFLLANIVEKTGGKSLEANIELVYNNAKLGAQIASAFNNID
ncbi:MAG: pseudouridine-5'-phosphate glycosidase [Acholeplasmatales bacterium]|nr:pseudouridine-5'-phosphate glycosidase [Acholeplasmatales bacterium]